LGDWVDTAKTYKIKPAIRDRASCNSDTQKASLLNRRRTVTFRQRKYEPLFTMEENKMKKSIFILLVSLLASISTYAQTTPTSTPSKPATTAETKPKRQIFRANKDQIISNQK